MAATRGAKHTQMKHILRRMLPLCMLIILWSGCSDVQLPSPKLPELPKLPDLSGEITDLTTTLRDLGLPDLSQIPNLPELADLPVQQTPPGAINYNGPMEHSLSPGDRLPGTNISLTTIGPDGAEFQIADLRSVRTIGDSLDYDGAWPGLPGAEYHLRARLYLISGNSVHVAGVHQLLLSNIQPSVDNSVSLSGHALQFPFTVAAGAGETFPGTTLRYIGSDERGAQLGGLAEGEYPYRKVGDSIMWKGRVRTDVAASYSLRMLYYTTTQARVGGVVSVALPGS
jgi:hypothetical protein